MTKPPFKAGDKVVPTGMGGPVYVIAKINKHTLYGEIINYSLIFTDGNWGRPENYRLANPLERLL